MSERIELGGRIFTPVKNSTIEHDFWLMGHIRAAGLDQVRVEEGENPDEFVMRLLREAINSGRVFLLLGGLMIQEGTPPDKWTPVLAKETAEFLKKLTAPEDKARIQQQVVSMLIGFFETGLASLRTSRRFSGKEAQPVSGNGAHTTTATGDM